jgi:uncharacterized SAM-dependent methyltransferase
MAGVELSTAQWDIEADSSDTVRSWHVDSERLILLLGHTLGNLESPPTALSNIQRSLRPEDMFAVSIALVNGTPQQMLAPYLTPFFTRAAIEPLRMLGYDVARGSFGVHYSEETRSVVGYFLPSERLVAGDGSNSVVLNAGQQLRCFLSRRFLPGEVAELLQVSGWKIIGDSVTPEADHQLVLARPQ